MNASLTWIRSKLAIITIKQSAKYMKTFLREFSRNERESRTRWRIYDSLEIPEKTEYPILQRE